MTGVDHVLDHVIKLLGHHIDLAEHGIMLIRLHGCLFITALSLLAAAFVVLTQARRCKSIKCCFD